MNLIKQIPHGRHDRFKVELQFHVKPDITGIEYFIYMKRLEALVKRKFIAVGSYTCEKKIGSEYIHISFFHCGYRASQLDGEFKLLLSELEDVIKH